MKKNLHKLSFGTLVLALVASLGANAQGLDDYEGYPFGDEPLVIPGIIQAENYDIGGQDVAFSDGSPDNNEGGAYRQAEDGDGVDVEVCESSSDNYDVGYTGSGEWMNYTVSIETAGYYSVEVRLASPDGRTGVVQLKIDGENVGDPIDAITTGGWQTYELNFMDNIELPAGDHLLTVYLNDGGINLDQYEFLLDEAIETGVNDQFANVVKVYPNPANSVLNVDIDANEANIEVLDVLGRSLKQVNAFGSQQINVCDLKAGSYFVKVSTSKETVVKNFIKR